MYVVYDALYAREGISYGPVALTTPLVEGPIPLYTRTHEVQNTCITGVLVPRTTRYAMLAMSCEVMTHMHTISSRDVMAQRP